MAAPAHASTGAYFEDSSAAPAFAVPAGVEAGDIVVIPIFLDGTVTIAGFPGGFTHAENSPSGLDVGGGSHSACVVWKRADVADTGTYDFTLSGETFVSGSALRVAGCVGAGDPWDTGADAAQDAASASVTPAVAITTAGADRLLIFAGTCWSGGTWTPPTGYTERVEAGFGLVTAADKAQALAGSTGPVTATCSGSDKRCAWLGALIGTASTTPLNLTDTARGATGNLPADTLQVGLTRVDTATAATGAQQAGTLLAGLTRSDTTVGAARAGQPTGRLLLGLTLTDGPVAAGCGTNTEHLLLGLTMADAAASGAAAGTTEALRVDLASLDTPTAGQAGTPPDQLVIDVEHRDASTAARTGSPPETLALGTGADLELADTPAAVRARGTSGVVVLDVIHADAAAAAFAGGTGGALSADLLHRDTGVAARLSGTAEVLLIPGDLVVADSARAARAAGTVTTILLSPAYTWPPSAGTVTVRRPAIGAVRIQRVATGTMTVT